jgi:hypothetical protein
MTLPFTSEQFFGVFAAFNQTFLVLIVALWLVSGAVVLGAVRHPVRRSRTMSLWFAALWLWNAVAYHALFFTRINPAAWIFAALFALQALLFLRIAARSPFEYFSSTGWRRTAGLGLVIYAFAYPFLTMALGHRYPAAPTFGVPCPTAILTIGALLTVRGAVPVVVAIIPILWSFVGGSAAVLLAVPTDFVLLAAGVMLSLTVFRRRAAPLPLR